MADSVVNPVSNDVVLNPSLSEVIESVSPDEIEDPRKSKIIQWLQYLSIAFSILFSVAGIYYFLWENPENIESKTISNTNIWNQVNISNITINEKKDLSNGEKDELANKVKKEIWDGAPVYEDSSAIVYVTRDTPKYDTMSMADLKKYHKELEERYKNDPIEKAKLDNISFEWGYIHFKDINLLVGRDIRDTEFFESLKRTDVPYNGLEPTPITWELYTNYKEYLWTAAIWESILSKIPGNERIDNLRYYLNITNGSQILLLERWWNGQYYILNGNQRSLDQDGEYEFHLWFFLRDAQSSANSMIGFRPIKFLR
jgi:hypothetical protein